MVKSNDDAYDLLKDMASNNYQWPSKMFTLKKAAGVFEVDATIVLTTQITALTNKIDTLNVHSAQRALVSCGILKVNTLNVYPSYY